MSAPTPLPADLSHEMNELAGVQQSYQAIKEKFEAKSNDLITLSNQPWLTLAIKHSVFESGGSVSLQDLPDYKNPLVHVYLAQQLQKAASPESPVKITHLVFTKKFPPEHADEYFGYFALGLENHTELSRVELRENYIDDRGIYYLASSLKNNLNLCFLDLAWNKIGNLGVFYLTEAIKSKQLKLYLNHNLISNIQPLIEKLDCLEVLSLSYNELNEEAVIALARALESNTTLKELHLDSVRMGPRGAKALIAMLEKNHTLTQLDLGKVLPPREQPYLSLKNSFAAADVEKINDLLRRNQFESAEAAGSSVQSAFQTNSSFFKGAFFSALTGFLIGTFMVGNILTGVALLAGLGMFTLSFTSPLLLAGLGILAVAGLGMLGLCVFTAYTGKHRNEQTSLSTLKENSSTTYLQAMENLGAKGDHVAADGVRLLPRDPATFSASRPTNTSSPLAPPKPSATIHEEFQTTPHPVPLILPARNAMS